MEAIEYSGEIVGWEHWLKMGSLRRNYVFCSIITRKNASALYKTITRLTNLTQID
jgi:hypothetical protein